MVCAVSATSRQHSGSEISGQALSPGWGRPRLLAPPSVLRHHSSPPATPTTAVDLSDLQQPLQLSTNSGPTWCYY